MAAAVLFGCQTTARDIELVESLLIKAGLERASIIAAMMIMMLKFLSVLNQSCSMA